MLDQPVPNPMAQNPNFHTHKVFASIGLILIGVIVVAAATWYFVASKASVENQEQQQTEVDKTTSGWETYKKEAGYNDIEISFKHPKDWEASVSLVDGQSDNANYIVTKGGLTITFFNRKERESQIQVAEPELSQIYSVKTRKITFYGKQEDATEKVAKDSSVWEIFPNKISNSFGYSLYSSAKVPTEIEINEMLKIVSTFKQS